MATTTGGGNATPVTVTTLAALNSAAGGTAAAVIYVKGVLAAGTIKVGSNKTIAGMCGAELHGHVDMSGSVNVIFRNLKVVGYNCSDGSERVQERRGRDHRRQQRAPHLDRPRRHLRRLGRQPRHHQRPDFVTISWTKFSYSTRAPIR